MRVRLLQRCDTTWGWKDAGFEFDHPDGHIIVEWGLAEEVKDEPAKASKKPAKETKTEEGP